MIRLTRNRIRKVLSEEAMEVQKTSSTVMKRQLSASSTDLGQTNDIEESSGSGWKPRYWRQQLDNIRQMRARRDAPVDSMGASACIDDNAPDEYKRFQVLLSLMLSSQTKDQVTSGAMERLRNHGCTVEQMNNISESELGELIKPVGFWKRKAEYIKKTANILKEKFSGDIPSTYDELCQLHGVGPKMAHLVMLIAWKQCTGIAVDTHVHRIANRLGWVQSKTSNPEATRKELESWMPRNLWIETNKLLVGFGQQTCSSSKPKCAECLNRNICPYALQHL